MVQQRTMTDLPIRVTLIDAEKAMRLVVNAHLRLQADQPLAPVLAELCEKLNPVMESYRPRLDFQHATKDLTNPKLTCVSISVSICMEVVE